MNRPTGATYSGTFGNENCWWAYYSTDTTDGEKTYEAGTLVLGAGEGEDKKVTENASSQPWRSVLGANWATLIKRVETYGGIAPTLLGSWFEDYTALKSFDGSGLDTSNTVALISLFHNDSALESVTGIGDWDTSNVTSTWGMAYVFQGCTMLTTIDIHGWNMLRTSWQYDMFEGCTSLDTIILGSNSVLTDTGFEVIAGYTDTNGTWVPTIINPGSATLAIQGKSGSALVAMYGGSGNAYGAVQWKRYTHAIAQFAGNYSGNANLGLPTVSNASGTAATIEDKVLGATITLSSNTFSRVGYTFGGWVCGADGKLYQPGETCVLGDSGVYAPGYVSQSGATYNAACCLFYVKWIERTGYNVAYQLNGGSVGGSSSVATKTNVSWTQSGLLPAGSPTRSSYTFGGWWYDVAGTSVQATSSTQFSSMVSGDAAGTTATLYAKWTYVPPPPPDPEPEPEPTPAPEPEPEPEPIVDPDPGYYYDEPEEPAEEPQEPEDPESKTSTDTKKTDDKEPKGLLSNKKESKSGESKSTEPLAISGYDGNNNGYGDGGSGDEGDGGFFENFSSAEAMQMAGTTVATVAAVGAVAGLMGVGMSVASAAMIGAASVGTAGAVGLTSAADLAADLAAASAAGASGRRRRDEDDDEEQTDDEQQ